MKEASKSVLSFGATEQSRSWGGVSQTLRTSTSSAGAMEDASSATRASGAPGAAIEWRSRRPLELRGHQPRAPTIRSNRGMTRSVCSPIECGAFRARHPWHSSPARGDALPVYPGLQPVDALRHCTHRITIEGAGPGRWGRSAPTREPYRRFVRSRSMSGLVSSPAVHVNDEPSHSGQGDRYPLLRPPSSG